MKVLILSCNTGGGHNSCGRYIQEELITNNIDSSFLNYFEIVNKTQKDYSNRVYTKSLGKKGGIFKYIYKVGEAYNKTSITSPIYVINKQLSKKLYKFIKDNNYDLVICPHLFPAQALTEIKKHHDINFIFVDTDYEVHPFTNEVEADYYVIPKGIEDKFINKGLNKNKLLPLGIPISSNYINSAKDIKNELNTNKKIVLILLGSMGFGTIEEIIPDLLNIKDAYYIIVCGRNKKLYTELQKYNNNSLKVLGFTKNINDLIKTSDIVISKPGGLSSTEITSFRKGLIHIFPIPGVETSNTEFFSKHNLSLVANNKEELIEYINTLLHNEKIYNKMINSQKEYISSTSAKDLIEFIKNNFK